MTQAISPKQIDAHLREHPSKVLIAEDEAFLAASLKHHIQQLGYEAIGPACNGQEAIEFAREYNPDLALVDLKMPVLDGLSAAAVLFKQMGIPVMIVSAHSDQDSVDAGKRIGIFGYLVKPVLQDQLRVNIEVAWAAYRQYDRLRSQVSELKAALEDRKYVERAKGMLMDRLRLGEDEAMRRLTRQARDTRRRLPDLARALVESEELLGKTAKRQ